MSVHSAQTKSTQLPQGLYGAGLHGGYSMPDSLQAELIRSVPATIPGDILTLSDEECLARLARAIEVRDSAQLEEVARLIGRLAVTIE
jgi:hypothetical protein